MSYTQNLIHIVFATEGRKPVLIKSGRKQLFSYIAMALENKKCPAIEINGYDDHIHILCDIHPTQNVSNLVKSIKIASNNIIKESGIFPDFENWQKGYASFSISSGHKEAMKNYILRQEEHHSIDDSRKELITLLKKNGIDFEDKHLE